MKLRMKIPLIFLLFAVIFYTLIISYISYVQTPGGMGHVAFLKVFRLFGILLGTTFLANVVLFQFMVSTPLNRLIKQLNTFNLYQDFSFKISPDPQPRRRDEIADLHVGFEKMAQRLIEAQGEQQDMIMALTHDIKTPLTSIRGFMELILSNQEISDIHKEEYLRLIWSKTDSIMDLLDELSAYSKNESELHTIEMVPLLLKPLYTSIAREYEAELAGLGYDLQWGEQLQDNDAVLANEIMLRRLFANIVSNAVRYAGTSELVVRFQAFSERDSVIIRIEDNGVGVPEDKLGLIFHKFYSSDGSRQRALGGTGLGLSICRSIITRFNGEITAYRPDASGLGIEFCIPRTVINS